MTANAKESLRFEIIKRLAPAFRHKALGTMQPIGLLSQLLSKKIQADQKDSEYLLNSLNEIKESVKAMAKTIDNIFSWLNPAEETYLPLNVIVQECLDLLKMEIHQSNVSFVNNVTSTDLVKVGAVRNLFSACLLTYIDTVNKASEVVVSTRLESKDITIEMIITPVTNKESKVLTSLPTFVDWSAIISLNESANLVRVNDRVLITNIA
jgi:hypothetical protein